MCKWRQALTAVEDMVCRWGALLVRLQSAAW